MTSSRSISMIPCISSPTHSSLFYTEAIVSLSEFLGLRFFSPSRVDVSMNPTPSSWAEASRRRSAGILVSFLTNISSPTLTFLHLVVLATLSLIVIHSELLLSLKISC
jgi:hypothetical protein